MKAEVEQAHADVTEAGCFVRCTCRRLLVKRPCGEVCTEVSIPEGVAELLILRKCLALHFVTQNTGIDEAGEIGFAEGASWEHNCSNCAGVDLWWGSIV